MRLIDDWEHTLVRSSAVWMGVLGSVFTTAAGYLILFQDALEHRLLFALAVICGGLGAMFSALVPVARVTKQKSISGDDDADH